ncbi:MAG: ComEC/Rec2 family competence protein, partial [Terriglobales bacterium]
MMRKVLSAVAVLVLVSSMAAKNARTLDIYFIDVEGGQSTLIVTPQGESLLIDTGWPGYEGRDADRIVAAAKQAGLKRIDYVLITHYHRDHVGGVPQLAAKIPVGEYIDHGPNQEDTPVVRSDYKAYQETIAHSKHMVLKPGDTLPLKGVHLDVLSAAGEVITTSLPGAGEANPYCKSEPEAADDPTENARSVGTLLTYGKFRFIDLGDLTKKKEIALMCPVNRVGTVDLFLVSHHGLDLSNSPALVDALHSRVAIIDNGAHKGAKPAAWQTVHDSPGLQGLWQLHYA